MEEKTGERIAISYSIDPTEFFIAIGLDQRRYLKVCEIASYSIPLLFFLPRNMGDHTDHAIIHCENILSLFNDFLTDYGKDSLTMDEKYIICLAIYLHDLGCLIGKRKNHGENSLNILSHQRFKFSEDRLGKEVLSCVRYAIKFHQKEKHLNEIPPEPIISTVRTPLMCAVFRLIDECDISCKRTRGALYEILMTFTPLRPRSDKYWQAHLSTINIVFKNKEILIHTENANRSRLFEKRLKKNLKEINEILETYTLPKLGVRMIEHR